MAARASLSLLRTDIDRRWLLRGAGAGVGALIVAAVVVMALIAVIVGNGTPGWGDQRTLSAVISTVTWSFAAAAAGAVGAWQAALGGAPDQAAARFAGALGPVCLIALVTVASFGLEGPGVAVLLIEAVVEAGAAVAGATALSRRLVAAS